MTAWAKLTATAGLLLCAALAPVNGMNLLVIAALCAAMARRARVPARMIAPFAYRRRSLSGGFM